MAGDATAKKCMFCGIDVAQVPRMKDAQGRYACKACAEQKLGAGSKSSAAAAAAVSAGPPVLDLADMAKSVPNSVLNAKQCTQCGSYMPPKGVICTSCGFNTETGKGVKTRVEKAVETAASKKARGGGAGINLSGATFAYIIIGVLVALFAGSFAYPPLVLGLYGVVLLYSLFYAILLVVAPFQDGESGWGIAAIASFFVPLVGFAMIYYVFFISERASLKILFLAQIVASVLFVAAAVLVGTEALEALGVQ